LRIPFRVLQRWTVGLSGRTAFEERLRRTPTLDPPPVKEDAIGARFTTSSAAAGAGRRQYGSLNLGHFAAVFTGS